MNFQSSPASQTVVSGAVFTENGSTSDEDTFLTDAQLGTEHTLSNTALTITPTIRSGQVLATNISLQGGTWTKTLTIQAMTVTEQITKVDDWTFTDTGTPQVLNDGEHTSQNAVTITPPQTGGGSGSGSG